MVSTTPFPVVDVTSWRRWGDEAMGTKEKFWCLSADDSRHLFKVARQGTGEDWAEKLAAEIARLLGLPCADVELATWEGQPGSLCRNFVTKASHVLVHGNELLQQVDTTYPVHQFRGVRRHTVDAVLEILDAVEPPPPLPLGEGNTTAADAFVGYLLLDAVITNGDRHHENWGVLQLGNGTRQLAPSYDHASSLGRELTDAQRDQRLTTRDKGYALAAYLSRARSAFFASVTDDKTMHPVDAFTRAAKQRPAAAKLWVARLSDLREDDLDVLLRRIPESTMSASAHRFARELLQLSRNQLLSLSL
jgi:hypothetical protein